MVTTPYYIGQDFGPKEGTAYATVMPQEGMRYVYDQQGTRHSVPTTFNVSSGGGYTSLYKQDPIAEELAAGIQGTDVYQGSPYALSNVPEFEGVQYATPDYNKYQDLYSLYMGGGYDASQDDFPIQAGDITGGQTIDTGARDAAQITGAADTLVTTPDYSNVTTATEPPGGGDPDMFYDPYSDVTTAVAPPSILNQEQTELGEIGRQNVSGNITDYLTGQTPPGGGDPEMYYDAPETYDPVEPGLDYLDLVGQDNTIESTMPQGSPGQLNPYEPQTLANTTWGNMVDDPEIPEGPTLGDVFTTKASADEVTTARPPMLGDEGLSMNDMLGSLDAPYGVNPNTGEPYQTPRTIADQNAAAAALGNVTEQETPESLYQKAKNYLGENVAGTIDWTSVAVKALVNKYVGGPVSLLFDAVKAMDLPGGPTFQTSKAIELGLAAPGETQDKYGINTQSMLGNYDEYNVDRVEELENNIERSQANFVEKHGSLDAINEYGKNWEGMNKRNLQELEDRREYVDRSGAGGDIQPDATDEDIAADSFLGDGAVAEAAPDLDLQEALDRAQGVETGDAAEAERIEAEKRAAREEVQRIENERAATAREEARQPDRPSRDQGGGHRSPGGSGYGPHSR